MALTIGLCWRVDGIEIDARLLALLPAIGSRGSLKQAIGDVGLSYRHAWELLGRLEGALGQRLVVLERGRGAMLTPLGERLAGDVRALEERLQPELRRAAAEFNRPLSRMRAAPSTRLRVCASHDLALDRLAQSLPAHGAPPIELRVEGSVDALASLTRRRCEIAGFHVPELPGRRRLLDPYRPWLRGRALRLLHFADRTQGLMVAKGNPLQVESIPDLARTHARFVNRQAGSGTRLFFDSLLAAYRVRPAQINGYRHEEFTHAAVAAMIASGAADAAFGIEAAAAQQGLSFVPIASERYFLAMRSATAASAPAQAFLKALGSRWFRNVMREMAGYTPPARVAITTVQQAFEQPET
jgi:molybdate transport repressor ModE-like protein